MTGVELHDVACSGGELALPFGGSAPVLGADQVGRVHVSPGRRLHRLREDRQALTGGLVRGLSLDLRVAVVQEGLGHGVWPDGECAAFGIDLEKRSGLVAAERGEAFPDLGQVAGDEQQVANGGDARCRPAVTMPP